MINHPVSLYGHAPVHQLDDSLQRASTEATESGAPAMPALDAIEPAQVVQPSGLVEMLIPELLHEARGHLVAVLGHGIEDQLADGLSPEVLLENVRRLVDPFDQAVVDLENELASNIREDPLAHRPSSQFRLENVGHWADALHEGPLAERDLIARLLDAERGPGLVLVLSHMAAEELSPLHLAFMDALRAAREAGLSDIDLPAISRANATYRQCDALRGAAAEMLPLAIATSLREARQGKLDLGPIQATLAWRAGTYLRQPLVGVPESLAEAATWISRPDRKKLQEARIENALSCLAIGVRDSQGPGLPAWNLTPGEVDLLVALVQREAPLRKDDLARALKSLLLALYGEGADVEADALGVRHGVRGASAEDSEIRTAKLHHREFQLQRFYLGRLANPDAITRLQGWAAEGWFAEGQLFEAAQQHVRLHEAGPAWTEQVLAAFPGLEIPAEIVEAPPEPDREGTDHSGDPRRGLRAVPPRNKKP